MRLSRKTFSDINEILQLANTTANQDRFVSQIINFLFKQVAADSSVVYLSTEKASKGDIEINLDRAYVKQYREYYYQHDPIRFVNVPMKNSVFLLEDMIDYKNFTAGEFYNDFLKPQKIHHKLYLNLISGQKHNTRIGLYRNRGARRFSKQEIQMLEMISPYLGHAMDYHKLLVDNRAQNAFFNILDKEYPKAFILLDDDLRIVRMNQAAKGFCQDLFHEDLGKNGSRLPNCLTKDCQILARDQTLGLNGDLIPPRKRILGEDCLQTITVSTQMLFKKIRTKKERFFLISLEKKISSRKQLNTRLEEKYNLTSRECEVVHYLFRGLKNAEIAQSVFLSEITVKKHIQHIFKKLKVSNRASAVRKISEERQRLTRQPGPDFSA